MRFFLLLLALSVAPACTASQVFIVTGRSIDQVGQQYIETESSMRRELADGKVSDAEFLEWEEFSNRFETFYETTADAWRLAQETQDSIQALRIGEAVTRIARELGRWYSRFKKAGLAPALPVEIPLQ